MSERETRGYEPVAAPGALPGRLWLATLIFGAVLWAAVAVAIALTDDTSWCRT